MHIQPIHIDNVQYANPDRFVVCRVLSGGRMEYYNAHKFTPSMNGWQPKVELASLFTYREEAVHCLNTIVARRGPTALFDKISAELIAEGIYHDRDSMELHENGRVWCGTPAGGMWVE